MAETQALELDVPILVSELWSGGVLVFPVSDPTLAAHGTPHHATAELRMFLSEYLASAPPEVVSRFELPADSTLEEVEVLIQREDLPRAVQISEPLAITLAVIPHGREAWVVVPALGHTFYVPPGEKLEEVARAEVQRIVAARELAPAAWLQLLPPKRISLERIMVPVERPGAGPAGRAASLRKRLADAAKRDQAVEVLESVGLALHTRDPKIVRPPVVGREKELELLRPLLSGEERHSVALVGPELVGKSAVVEAWIAAEKKPIYSTSAAQLVAGMSGLGQWQERLRRVLEAAEILDAVLYFENLADLFGDRPSSSIDIAGAMKPWLEERRVRVAGEITPEGLDLHASRNVGFFACFEKLRVEPFTAKRSVEVLEQRISHAEKHEPDRPNLSREAIQTVIDLAERYWPYRPFPGKVVRFFDDLRAGAERDPSGAARVLGSEEVLSAFAVETGIPVFLLREDRELRAEQVVEYFEKRIIGQKEAIRRVVETVCIVKAGLQPAGKPLATFLFIGPTGVGKTELARTLASFLFGAPDRMVRFDMSEYMDPFAAERLIRGSDRADGLLTRQVRQQPFCVLLLDEIEKAHSSVFDLLLQVAGEGRLTDARGKTAYFHNAIIIMTSNLGAAHRRATVGIGASSDADEAYYLKQVDKAFRPELVNRLDRIIVFRSLSPEEVLDVARVGVEKVKARRGLLEAGINVDVSESALSVLARTGYSESYGARALRRHLEDHLVAPVSRLVGKAGGDAKNAQVVATPLSSEEVRPSAKRGFRIGGLEAGGLRFDLHRGREGATRSDLRALSVISDLRRQAARWMALPTVEQLRERVGFLVSQLSAAPPPGDRRDKRPAREVSELSVEHHRLNTVWARALQLDGDLASAEELALIALYEGGDPAAVIAEGRASFAELKKNLVYLLVAEEPKRDEVTLMLQEQDDGRAFDHWLAPLLEDVHARGWSAEIHVFGGEREPGDEWPMDRRWGPPRSPEWTLSKLELRERPFRNLLLRVRGLYAGILLALEAGVHRYHRVHPTITPVYMTIHGIALRSTLTEKEWSHSVLTPPPPLSQAEVGRIKAVREVHGIEEKIGVVGGRRTLEIPLAHYWRRFEEIALEHLLLYEEEEDLERAEMLDGWLDQPAPGMPAGVYDEV